MKRFQILIILFFMTVNLLGAASVDVMTNTRESYVGQPITFTIRVISSRTIGRPPIPEIPGFQMMEAGESRYEERSLGGGGSSRRVTSDFTWTLIPLRHGEFAIPSIPIEVEGDIFQTDRIGIRIKEPAPVEGYKLILESDRQDVFPGLPVRIRLKWLISSEVSRPDFTIPFFKNENIIIEDLEPPSSSAADIYKFDVAGRIVYAYQSAEILEGKQYASLNMEWNLYPEIAGTIELEEVFLAFHKTELDKNGRKNTVPLVIPSNRLVLNVKALPPELANYKAADFIADNELSIVTSLSHDHIYPGDPVEFTIRIQGLNNPKIDSYQGADFIPELQSLIKTDKSSLDYSIQNDIKTYNQKIRFISSSIKSFPALKIPYYSIEKGKVLWAESNEIPIEIENIDPGLTIIEDSVESGIPVEVEKGIQLEADREDLRSSISFLRFIYNHKIKIYAVLLGICTLLLILHAIRQSPYFQKEFKKKKLIKKCKLSLDTFNHEKSSENAQNFEFALLEYVKIYNILNKDQLLQLLLHPEHPTKHIADVLDNLEKIQWSGDNQSDSELIHLDESILGTITHILKKGRFK